MTIVVDASVAVSWCFPDEDDVYANRVLDLLKEVDAVVPAIWAVEIANAMVNGHRRARIDDRRIHDWRLAREPRPIRKGGHNRASSCESSTDCV